MSVTDIIQFLHHHQGERIALVAHVRPDGDALGSCIGLADCLTRAGYRARAINPLPLPDYLRFMVRPELVAWHENPDWWRDYDCLGVLDCGEAGRLDGVNREALDRLPVFNIDHHASTGTGAGGLGQAAWVRPEASSVGEMVVRLAREAGWALSPVAAQALWTAIVTDTGRFSYENTTADALEAARECVAAGASPSEAATHLYQSVTVAERRLQLVVLERMHLYEEGRLAVSWLRREDFARAGIGVEGAQNLINLLRDTAGVEVALFCYEPPGSESDAVPVKVSFRTRSPHDALRVTARFGGGGHQRAAGCSLPGPMETARGRVLEATVREFFPQIKNGPSQA